MPTKRWITGAVLTAAIVAGATIAIAATNVMTAKGPVARVTTSGRESGRYRLTTFQLGAKHVEQVYVGASKLDRTKDVNGVRPEYHVWLVSADGATEVDFGKLPTNKFGTAKFLFDTRSASLPAGVTTIEDFEGGKIEIRGASGAVLRSQVAELKRKVRKPPGGGGGGGGGYGGGYGG